MANIIAKTTGYVVRQAALGFYNSRLYSGLIEKKYDDTFADKAVKKGSQIFVKRPSQYIVRVGATYAAQDILDQQIPVTIGEQIGVDFEFSTREATLDMEAGRPNLDIQSAGSSIASFKDAEGLKVAADNAGYTIITTATPTLKNFLQAKAILNKMLAPKNVSERFAVVGSDVETEIVNEVKVLYNSSAEITKAIKEGVVTSMAGLNWTTSDLTYVRTNGAGGIGGLTIGAVIPGASTATKRAYYTASLASNVSKITLAGATPLASLAVGDTLEFASCFFVNQETKMTYANKLQRKVLAIAGAVVDVEPIYPVISSPADAEERGWAALANCTAFPANGSTVAVLGTSGTKYLVSIVQHKSAVNLTSVDLVMPEDVKAKDRIQVDGMSIRYLQTYANSSDTIPNRLDTLSVYTPICRPWIVALETPLA
jgi:hypothetical protein